MQADAARVPANADVPASRLELVARERLVSGDESSGDAVDDEVADGPFLVHVRARVGHGAAGLIRFVRRTWRQAAMSSVRNSAAQCSLAGQIAPRSRHARSPRWAVSPFDRRTQHSKRFQPEGSRRYAARRCLRLQGIAPGRWSKSVLRCR